VIEPARLPASLAALALLLTIEVGAAGAAERLPLIVETAQGPRTFQVELAVTNEQRARGLMFRRTLEPDHGMLFDFETESRVAMWMRNTYIPLDMLFIGTDREIKEIVRDTTPLSERTIQAGVPVRYVLEINASVSDALGIAPGDTVSGPALEGR
jgi:uncharacterized protein